MRWMVWLLVIFAAAVGAALLVRFNHGNVAVLWPPYRVEVSVNLALALLATVFVGGYLVLIAAGRALRLPQRVREYRQRRVQDQAVGALRDSVLAFFEGRLARAERFAQTAQGSQVTAAAASLIAARSAQRMQEQARRDRWLQEAGADGAAANALLMTQAEFAVEDRRTQEAIELVGRLHAHGARHIVSLRTALRAYEQAERWDDVLRTLRLIEKRDALHPAAVRRLREKAHAALVERKANDAVGLRELWRSMRADERALPEVVVRHAAALADAGAPEDARRMVEQALDAAFAEPLAHLYARLGGIALRDRLERLEGWRARYGDEPALLLALGRVCVAERLWGKAEDYLRLAQRREPSVAVHVTLAELYESLQRDAEAAEQYRAAARLAAGERPASE